MNKLGRFAWNCCKKLARGILNALLFALVFAAVFAIGGFIFWAVGSSGLINPTHMTGETDFNRTMSAGAVIVCSLGLLVMVSYGVCYVVTALCRFFHDTWRSS